MKRILTALLLCSSLIAPALADSTHDTTTTGGDQTQGQGQNQGQGQVQGQAQGQGQGQGQGQSQSSDNTNVNANSNSTFTAVGVDNKNTNNNSNVGVNDSHNTAISGSSSSVRDSGNSASLSGAEATGGTVKNSGNSSAGASANTGASTSSATGGASTANAAASGNGNGNNGGGNGAIGNSVTIKTPRAASSSFAPDNRPTADCMGTSSLGVSLLTFGFSGGTSWPNTACEVRSDERDLMGRAAWLASQGLLGTGISMLCTEDKNMRSINPALCANPLVLDRNTTYVGPSAPPAPPATMAPVGH